MALIIASFLLMVTLTFSVVMFSTRPTTEQKALDKRIGHIKVAPGQVGGDTSGLLLATPDSGAFSFIDDLIEKYKVSEQLRLLLLQSDTNMTIGKLIGVCGGVGFALLAVTYLFKSNFLLAFLVGLQGCAWPILFFNFKRKRRVDAFNAGLADSIDMMSRSLRAGHSVVAAIGIVAEQAVEPVKFEFNEVFKKQNYGLPLRDCLMELLDRVPSQDLRVLVTGMLVQKETGGNLAEILDRICFVIRERLRIKGEIRTHTAQGRLTGWILCLLPIVMLFAINWINPGYSDVLFETPTGNKLLYLGVALLFTGGFIIRKIINGIEV